MEFWGSDRVHEQPLETKTIHTAMSLSNTSLASVS